MLILLIQVNSKGIHDIGQDVAKLDVTFPVMYTFAPYQDGETILADPFEAWSYYRDGKVVNGK